MRQYLLDSAPLAAYLNGRQVAVDLINPWITHRETATSILVYGEITEYLKGLSHFPRRHAQLRRLAYRKNKAHFFPPRHFSAAGLSRCGWVARRGARAGARAGVVPCGLDTRCRMGEERAHRCLTGGRPREGESARTSPTSHTGHARKAISTTRCSASRLAPPAACTAMP